MQKVLRAFVFLWGILPSFCLFLRPKTLRTSHCSPRTGAKVVLSYEESLPYAGTTKTSQATDKSPSRHRYKMQVSSTWLDSDLPPPPAFLTP